MLNKRDNQSLKRHISSMRCNNHAEQTKVLVLIPILFSRKIISGILSEYHQSVKQFGSRSGPAFGWPNLGPNYFKCTSHLYPPPPRGRGIAGLLTFQFSKPC